MHLTDQFDSVVPGVHAHERVDWARGELPERPEWFTRESSRLQRRLDSLALSLLSRVTETPVIELDRVARDALAELRAVLDVDCVTVWATAEDRSDLAVRRGWSIASAPCWPIEQMREALPELTATLVRGEPVELQHVADHQAHASRERGSLQGWGIRGLVALPLRVGGMLEGALCVACVHRATRWPMPMTLGLRSLGHALAVALLRARVEKRGSIEQTTTLGLTDRQLEVLGLLRRGHTMKEVAERLGISPRTVAFHKHRIREITGARTNAELIRKAVEGGLAEH